MEEAYQLAKEIQERSGITLDREIIENTAKHMTSHKSGRKEDDRNRRSRHHRRREDKQDRSHGGGDTHHLKHGDQDRDLDYIDDPVAKIYAPEAVVRELEKLNARNKDLQTKAFLDEQHFRRLNDKIDALKEQLDDESVGTMKLVADREYLKLQIEDYKRKFFAVLLLSGLSETDVTHFFQKNPRANEITDEMINVKQEMEKYAGHDKRNKYEQMNPIILNKRVDQLEKWSEQLNAACHDRVNALKDDILLMKLDHRKVVDDLTTRTQNMAQMLNENNEVVHLVLSENLKLKDARAEIEATFKKERKHLLEFLKSNDLDHTNILEGPNKLVQNAQMDALTIKKLQKLLSRAQNDLIRRENEIESYRAEFLKMEKKVARAMMEKEEYEKLYEETVGKMNESNEILVRRADKIDQRRKLEAAGFRKDVKELTRFLTDLQKKMNYCLSARFERKMTEDVGDTALFRDTLRSLSLDESAKKNIVKNVRAKHKRMELEKDRDRQLEQTKSSGSRKNKLSVQSKPTNPTQTKLNPGVIKFKLSKLSTPKGLRSKEKPKPEWADITRKDYSAKPREGVRSASKASKKNKDDKRNSEGPSESKIIPKMKSSGAHHDEDYIEYKWDGAKWLDEDMDTLLEMFKPPEAKQRSTGSSTRRSPARNDENNNTTVEEIRKQLKQASKCLDEIKRSSGYSKILRNGGLDD